MLPKLGVLMKIACFLNNLFGKRLNSDDGMSEEVVQRTRVMRNEHSC